jgi:hypothetical protein
VVIVVTAEDEVGPAVELEPADELHMLVLAPPDVDDSVAVWLVWHDRHIRCWERIAAEHSFLADYANYMADMHVCDMRRLLADPTNLRLRQGYWDLLKK